MKFWLTLVAGIVVVTALSTALYVYNPHMQRRLEPARPVATQQPKDEGVPKAVAEVTEKTEKNVRQVHSGETVFDVRNDGDGVLKLRPGTVNCVCAGAEIRREQTRSDGSYDFLKTYVVQNSGRFQYDASPKDMEFLELRPGERAQFILRWVTKLETGEKVVHAPLITNDVLKRLEFRVTLNITSDLMVEPQVVEFGPVDEGKKAEQVLFLYSTVRDDLKLENAVSSHKNLQVRLRPLTAEEAQKRSAKSGLAAIVTLDSTMPIGPFFEKFSVSSNLEQLAAIDIGVNGDVTGSIEVVPSKFIDFKVVPGSGGHTEKRSIFARGLPPDVRLVVGEHAPEFLRVSLAKHPRFKGLWTLSAEVPPEAPAGEFHGQISICDGGGNTKVNVPLRGVVTGTALSRAAAE